MRIIAIAAALLLFPWAVGAQEDVWNELINRHGLDPKAMRYIGVKSAAQSSSVPSAPASPSAVGNAAQA